MIHSIWLYDQRRKPNTHYKAANAPEGAYPTPFTPFSYANKKPVSTMIEHATDCSSVAYRHAVV